MCTLEGLSGSPAPCFKTLASSLMGADVCITGTLLGSGGCSPSSPPPPLSSKDWTRRGLGFSLTAGGGFLMISGLGLASCTLVVGCVTGSTTSQSPLVTRAVSVGGMSSSGAGDLDFLVFWPNSFDRAPLQECEYNYNECYNTKYCKHFFSNTFFFLAFGPLSCFFLWQFVLESLVFLESLASHL